MFAACLLFLWTIANRPGHGAEGRQPSARGYELPNVKQIDCEKVGLHKILAGKPNPTCTKIHFKSSGRIEYAGLTSPGKSPNVLTGPLFKVVEGEDGQQIEEIEDSRVSTSLNENYVKDYPASMMISGTEETEDLLKLRYNLQTGETQ